MNPDNTRRPLQIRAPGMDLRARCCVWSLSRREADEFSHSRGCRGSKSHVNSVQEIYSFLNAACIPSFGGWSECVFRSHFKLKSKKVPTMQPDGAGHIHTLSWNHTLPEVLWAEFPTFHVLNTSFPLTRVGLGPQALRLLMNKCRLQHTPCSDAYTWGAVLF